MTDLEQQECEQIMIIFFFYIPCEHFSLISHYYHFIQDLTVKLKSPQRPFKCLALILSPIHGV